VLGDDLAQDTMLVAMRRWDEVRGFESPAGWVRAVCLRKSKDLIRRRTLERDLLARLGSLRAPPTGEAVPDDESFWSLVRQLPMRQGQVVALHYALDLPITEVAVILGCAEGTVKVHLSRARAALAALLETKVGTSE
jgi:RNA polymerase sigma-70 factor (ECF subfamily)